MSGKVAITAFNMITAFGHGVDISWQSLLDNHTAIGAPKRISKARFEVAPVAESQLIDQRSADTSVWQLCRMLLDDPSLNNLPPGTELFLSTTVGEIELLERAVDSKSDASSSCLSNLCLKVEALLGLPQGHGTVVSAACASGSSAIALAAQRIRLGLAKSALIVACDGVSEFVLAGFNSLMALDKQGARPFDRSRQGLSLGDGAAFMVLMGSDYAQENNIPILAEVAGWGMSDDANHITGPSRDGSGLASAIKVALETSGVSAKDISFISAHGTGTLYNDAMEMQSFKKIFQEPVALYGIKGAIGHTLGAAGLIEVGIAVHALRESLIPPTVGLSEPDPEAFGWVSSQSRGVVGEYALCVNAGFGGVNAAVCLKKSIK
ncbi:MAG: beta-ketoacyl-[acyl-carrier-protein] synthase family protein [Candidatus Omnitrophica bacterium]|nr:beta-ketoacyl-[acyl-carrier-protein] synthase family protein [Candidatus Omnitrophota bacterium]